MFWPNHLQFPLDNAQTVAGGFSGAKIWKISSGGQDFCLRRWPKPGPPPERLQGLRDLLQFIQNTGLPVTPVPLLTPVESAVAEHAGRQWQLEPWHPGTADFHQSPRPERLREVCRVLRQWHLAAQRHSPQPEHQEWFATRIGPPEGLRRRLESWNDWERKFRPITAMRMYATMHLLDLPELQQLANQLQRVGANWKQNCLQLVEQPVPLQPCLRDLWHDHVLWEGDTVTGLIDAGACHTDHVAADLSRLLGSLVGDDQEQWRAAIAAYGDPAEPAFWQLLQTYDQSQVVLSAATWLQWLCVPTRPDLCTALEREDSEDLHTRVTVRIRRLCERLKRLIDRS